MWLHPLQELTRPAIQAQNALMLAIKLFVAHVIEGVTARNKSLIAHAESSLSAFVARQQLGGKAFWIAIGKSRILGKFPAQRHSWNFFGIFFAHV
jgi:hypothetical protein